MWSDPPALARAVALGALAWLGLASWSCGGDDEDSVIDVVVIEPEPGLPSRLESVRIEVTRLGATSEETRAVTRAARYGERLLEPWTERLRPQRSDDPGHTLYRIVATGLRGGRPYVSSQARLVFVPGSRVVLPLRLEAACVGAACGPDETCRAGACTDDWVASCDLVAGGTPAYCRSPMDAGLARDLGAHDSGPEDAGPSDAGAVDAEPMDAGPVDAGPMDAGPMDAGPMDAGPMDAGPVDAGPMDTGPMDTGPMDAGPMDTGPMDTGPMDTGPMDTGPMDAGPMDAGPMDAGPMDTGPMDTGPMDTGPMDTGPMDAGDRDAASVADLGIADSGPDAGPDAGEGDGSCAAPLDVGTATGTVYSELAIPTHSAIGVACRSSGSIASQVLLWRAPATATYRVSTCGSSNLDTAVSVRSGSCAGPELACNDEGLPACFLGSRVELDLAAGETVVIVVDYQLLSFPALLAVAITEI